METYTSNKSYPIATAISCYKEAKLVQGAIQSVSCLSGHIWVWEGRNNPDIIDTEPTELSTDFNGKIHWNYGEWESEAAKRTAIVRDIKDFYSDGCWILSLDADEILVWGEYLQGWVDTLTPGYPDDDENVVPILMSELNKESVGGWFCRQSNGRLIHSSMIDYYELASVVFIAPDGKKGYFNHETSPRIPFPGEPHLHHRDYLRKPDRAKFRQHSQEEIELQELNDELREQWKSDRLSRGMRTITKRR